VSEQPGAGSSPCPNCGGPVAPGARFCGTCGHDLSQPAAAPPTTPLPVPAEAAGRSKLPPPALLVVGGMVLVALVAGAIVLFAGGSSSPDAQIKGVLDKEVSLIRQGRYQDIFALLSPQYQQQCSVEDLQSSGAQESITSLGPIRFDDLRAAVQGDNARVTYRVTVSGKELATVTADDPDLFVKVDGEWRDDYDDQAFC
jgi:Double zinc ribbon